MNPRGNNDTNGGKLGLGDWVRKPLERMNQPSNFESIAESSGPLEDYYFGGPSSKSLNDYTRASNLRTGSMSSMASSVASTPSNSPLIRRKGDQSASSSSSGNKGKDSGNNWLSPIFGPKVLTVTNFDINAVGPTSW